MTKKQRKAIQNQNSKDLEEKLKKAVPAVFGLLPANEVTPRYVAFKVPPEIFHHVRKWLDLGLKLAVLTGSRNEWCQICIINETAVKDYNIGRKPPE